jgi:hypothetical protein
MEFKYWNILDKVNRDKILTSLWEAVIMSSFLRILGAPFSLAISSARIDRNKKIGLLAVNKPRIIFAEISTFQIYKLNAFSLIDATRFFSVKIPSPSLGCIPIQLDGTKSGSHDSVVLLYPDAFCLIKSAYCISCFKN